MKNRPDKQLNSTPLYRRIRWRNIAVVAVVSATLIAGISSLFSSSEGPVTADQTELPLPLDEELIPTQPEVVEAAPKPKERSRAAKKSQTKDKKRRTTTKKRRDSSKKRAKKRRKRPTGPAAVANNQTPAPAPQSAVATPSYRPQPQPSQPVVGGLNP